MIRRLKSSVAFRTSQQRTKPVRHFLRKFQNDWSTDFAAMLAFNLLIALLPIAVSLFGISGLILKNLPDLEARLKDKIIHLFPVDNSTQAGIEQVVDLAFSQLSKDAGFILALGLVFALFGASRLVVAIDKSLTIIYRLPEREFLRQNLLAIGMIFLFVLIIPLMIGFSSAPSALVNVIPGGGGRFGTFLAGTSFSLIVGFILFETIFWLIPNKKMSFKVTWCGSLVSALTLELFMLFFPFYVRRFMGNYAGQIGFAVILLLFFYYFATILIVGAQINAFFFENYRPLSVGLGTYINKMHRDHGLGQSDRYLHEPDHDQEQSLPFNAANETNAEGHEH